MSLIACGKGHSSFNSQDQLIITLPAKDSVIIVDPFTQTEKNRLTLGKLPHNIRLNADKNKAYVVLVGSQSVAEIEVTTGQLLQMFLTDPTPMIKKDGTNIEPHIIQNAVSHRTCFDCHNGSASGAKPAVVGSRPFGIVIDNNQLIVANTRSGNINFIDLFTAKIVKTLTVDTAVDAHEPTDLAIFDNRLYVTVRPILPSYLPAQLSIYDLETFELLSQSVVGSAVSAVEINIKRQEIYTTNFDSNSLDVFNLEGSITKNLIVGNGPLGLTMSDDFLFVANYYANNVSRMRFVDDTMLTQDLLFIERQFSNPTHLSLSLDEQHLYVISGGTTGYLLTLNAENLSIIRKMEIDGLPFDITTIKNIQ